MLRPGAPARLASICAIAGVLACARETTGPGNSTDAGTSYTKRPVELLLGVAGDHSFLLYAYKSAPNEISALYVRAPGAQDIRLADEFSFLSLVGNVVSWVFDGHYVWWPALAAPLRIGPLMQIAGDGSLIAYFDDAARALVLIRTSECRLDQCTRHVLAEGIEGIYSQFSRDGRWLAFHASTTTRTKSLSLADTDTGVVRLLEEQETGPGWQGDLGRFAPDASALIVHSRMADRSRFRAYSTRDGTHVDWPELPAGWIDTATPIDAQRLRVIFAPRDEPGFVVGIADAQGLHPEAEIPGTSTLWLFARGTRLLEVGGDLSDIHRARLFDFSSPGLPAQTISERYMDLADIAPDGSRLAFFEDSPDFSGIPSLVAVSLSDGARVTIAPAIAEHRTLHREVELHGTETIVYLDSGDPAVRAGRLHVHRRGEDRIVAIGVVNFELATDARVYYTAVPEDSISFHDGARIESAALPE